MKTFLCITIVLGGVLAAAKPSRDLTKHSPKSESVKEAGDSIEGIYWCVARRGSKKYRATTTVLKVGNFYMFQWQLLGGASFEGIGLRRGNKVAVACTMGKSTYAYLYVVKGAVLEGDCGGMTEDRKFDNEPFHETLELIKRLPEGGD